MVETKDKKEAQNVAEMIKSIGRSYVLTGATKNTSSSPWLWQDGSAVDLFDNWASGEPNTPSYLCQYIQQSNAEWRDYPCSSCPDSKCVACQQTLRGMGLCHFFLPVFPIKCPMPL